MGTTCTEILLHSRCYIFECFFSDHQEEYLTQWSLLLSDFTASYFWSSNQLLYFLQLENEILSVCVDLPGFLFFCLTLSMLAYGVQCQSYLPMQCSIWQIQKIQLGEYWGCIMKNDSFKVYRKKHSHFRVWSAFGRWFLSQPWVQTRKKNEDKMREICLTLNHKATSNMSPSYTETVRWKLWNYSNESG